MNKIPISWDKIHNVCEVIACILNNRNFLNKNDPVYIYGIPRGGLIPAVVLSHRLDSMGYKTQLIFNLNLRLNYNNVIMIDDIADTGCTFTEIMHINNRMFELITISLFKRKTSGFEPTIVGEVWDGDEWLIFPWEHRDAPTQRDKTLC